MRAASRLTEVVCKKCAGIWSSTPQYINDTKGNRTLFVLPVQEFETLMEELEELEDIRLFDEAKKEDTGERMLFSDYPKIRKARNA